MLGTRLIACLVVKNGIAVQSIGFSKYLPVCRVEIAVEYLSRWGIDEIVIVDIDASRAGRSFDLEMAQAAAGAGFVPLTLGGGIKSVAEIRMLLKQGADKICLNNSARLNPGLISEAAKVFGSQCIVVGIDSFAIKNNYKVHLYTGDPDQSKESSKTTNSWISEVQDRGAGEIVLNCMNQDGVREGYDLGQLREMRNLCKVPLIASGGAGKMSDFYDVFNQADVSGSLAASVFHKKIIDISDLKKYLQKKQIEVRL